MGSICLVSKDEVSLSVVTAKSQIRYIEVVLDFIVNNVDGKMRYFSKHFSLKSFKKPFFF